MHIRGNTEVGMVARQRLTHAAPDLALGSSIRELPWAGIAALLSLGAAGLHWAVAPDHFGEYWVFGAFFVLCAWLQAAWSVAITSRPSRFLLWIGIVGNLALAAFWLYTRAVQVPIGPDAGSPEAYGRVDELCVIFEVATAAVAAGLLAIGWQHVRRPSDWWVLVPSSVVMMALIGWVLWSSPIM